MEMKETLKKIRGWFPQEPRLRIQEVTPKTRAKTIANAIVSFSPVIIVIGIFCWFVLLSDSWIQSAAFIGTAVGVAAYVLSRRHFRLRRRIRYILTIAMLCIIVFTAVETYMFWNAGYPPTYSPADPKNTLTLESTLDASVLEIVQDIKQSPAFSLLKLEHTGEFKFHSMTFTPTDLGGYLEVNFICEEDGVYAHFFSGNGNQYRLIAWYSDITVPSGQSSNAQLSLREIDQVGLRGFYNQAIELANNKTADLSSIDTLDINIVYLSDELRVQVIWRQNDSSFFVVSSFQPNGELINIYTPGTAV